mmetsp:Transcript_9860/g.20394  ORF Transcript_9860/g.20394 Transcript_9860/m.20394 type:complete len:179 (-) Transcript_9860:639-1175(-)
MIVVDGTSASVDSKNLECTVPGYRGMVVDTGLQDVVAEIREERRMLDQLVKFEEEGEKASAQELVGKRLHQQVFDAAVPVFCMNAVVGVLVPRSQGVVVVDSCRSSCCEEGVDQHGSDTDDIFLRCDLHYSLDHQDDVEDSEGMDLAVAYQNLDEEEGSVHICDEEDKVDADGAGEDD